MRTRILLLLLCAAMALPLLPPRRAAAQQVPIRLSVNKWKVEPGDSYSLNWMESGSVQAMSDFVIEEDTDPQFKDKDNYSRYVVRAHRKAFENSTAFSHTVRYYRVRARAWVRNADEQQIEDEVVSNTVRVTLLGTDKAPAPSFADDPPEPPVKKPKKDDKDKKPEDEFPAMGRPDMIILKITTDPPVPVANKPFRVRVTVRNTGVVPAEGVQVRVEVAGRQFITDCEPLRPNFAVDTVTPPVTCETAGPQEITATVDPFDRLAESREDNNVKKTKIEIAEAPKAPTGNNDGPGGGSANNGGK